MLMECVFTSQKHKKKKKWEDGFIAMNGQSITLYNEERRVLCKNRFTVRDENEYECGLYIIYCEGVSVNVNDSVAISDTVNVSNGNNVNDSVAISDTVNVNDSVNVSNGNNVNDNVNNTVDFNTINNTPGRSTNEILNLFKNNK